MPNYSGYQDLPNGARIWEFQTEDGGPLLTDNPTRALEWGAPVGNEESFMAPPAAQALAPMPEALPDTRTANYTEMFTGDNQPGPAAQRSDTESLTADFYTGGMSQPEPAMSEALTSEASESDWRQYDAQQARERVTLGPGGGSDGGSGNSAVDLYKAGLRDVVMQMPLVNRGGGKGGWQPGSRQFKGAMDDQGNIVPAGQQLVGLGRELTAKEMQIADKRQELEYQRLENAEKERATFLNANLLQQEQQKQEVAQAEEWKKSRLAELAKERDAIWSRAPEQNRVFRDMSAGASFLALLSIGAGAFGGSITGQPNYALDMFNKVADTDLRIQEAEIAQAKDLTKLKENALAQELAEGRDPSFARDKLKYLMLEHEKARLERAEYQQQLNTLGVDVAQYKAGLVRQQIELEASLAEKLGVEYSEKYRAGGGGGLVGVDELKKRMEFVDAISGGGEGAATTVFDWQGQPHGKVAGSKEEVSKVRDRVADSRETIRATAELISIAKQLKQDPTGKLSPTLRARAKSLAKGLQGSLRTDIVGPGAVTESEWKILEGVVADPTELTRLADPVVILGGLQDKVLNKTNSVLSSRGLQPLGMPQFPEIQ